MIFYAIDYDTENPIPYASVMEYDREGKFTGNGTTANENGKFSLSPSPSAKGIEISSVGYVSDRFQYGSDTMEGTEFYLKKDEKELGGVIIKSKKKSYAKIIVVVLVAAALTYLLLKNKKDGF